MASIGPGQTLLLYTDGLIETRQATLDDRQALLLDAVRAHARLAVDDLLDAVVRDMVDDEPADDVAVIAVRFDPKD